MTKVPLQSLSTLTNEASALTKLNSNFTATQAGFEKTLSRDGTTPNQMMAALDMNGNRILNVPPPVNANDLVRLQDLTGEISISTDSGSIYSLKSDVESVTVPVNVSLIRTGGYTSYGLGGGWYKRVLSEPSHAGKIKDAGNTWFELVFDQDCNPAQFGASPSALSSTNTTAFNNFLTFVGSNYLEVDLQGETYTLSARPTSTYGVRFKNGKVLAPQLGGTNQINLSSDKYSIIVGRENLAAFMKYATAGTSQAVPILGDSTVEQNGTYPEKPEVLVWLAALKAGINNIHPANYGASGTSWGDNSLVSYLGSNVHLAIYKYGINDAVKSNALATISAAMDTELSAVRAASYGSFSNLSIVLFGPNITIRPSTGQNATWYESLRELYIEKARKYQCLFFDTYAYMSTADGAPGFWLDDIVTGPYHEGIHPDPVSSYWFWKQGMEMIFNGGDWNASKSNYLLNFKNTDQAPTNSYVPTGFRYGRNMHVALASNGFPADGILYTDVQIDGIVSQMLYTQEVKPRVLVRTGNRQYDVWTQWANTYNTVTLTNSWVSAAGDGYATPGYKVGNDGFIDLYGAIKNGTSGASAFTLPTTARPVDGAHGFTVPTSAIVIVGVDGTVKPTGTTTLVCLDGIRFRCL